MSAPTADVSVRVAWSEDAPAIARLQRAVWAERFASHADTLPDLEGMAAAWAGSLTRPPDARQRVLVALVRNHVVGFAITSPATDPDCSPLSDGEVQEFTVAVEHRRQGHGSRLVHATVDTLKADRFDRALTWIAADDDILRTFLTAAGWGPDGAHRELGDEADASVKQVRLHTIIG